MHHLQKYVTVRQQHVLKGAQGNVHESFFLYKRVLFSRFHNLALKRRPILDFTSQAAVISI